MCQKLPAHEPLAWREEKETERGRLRKSKNDGQERQQKALL